MRFTRKNRLLSYKNNYRVRTACRAYGFRNTAPVLVAAISQRRFEYDIHLVAIHLLNGFQRGNGMFLFAVEHPCSQLLVRSVRHRADDGYRTYIIRQRKRPVTVLQENYRLFYSFFCGLQMFLRVFHTLRCSDIRIIEQAHTEFQAENITYRIVYRLHGHYIFLQRPLQVLDKGLAHHIHIHPGIDRLLGGILTVCAEAVIYHFGSRSPVCHYHSVELPFIAQDVFQYELVCRTRHAVVIIERSHESGTSRIYCGLERGKIHITQHSFGNKRRIIIFTAFGSAISHKVLCTCCH